LAENAGDDIGIDERLVRLASQPARLRALWVLNERAAGVSEVAEELGLSVEEAARHLEQMHEAGLIEVVGEVLRRGAVEPRYKATVHVAWSDAEWAELSLEERRRLSTWIVQTMYSDVMEALESGSFNARVDTHASRSVSAVDEQGWEELVQIHNDALEAVLATQAACAERLAERGEEGMSVLSAIICCELPGIPATPS
jgi:DNA-binding Lrp family transcriptional regulator